MGLRDRVAPQCAVRKLSAIERAILGRARIRLTVLIALGWCVHAPRNALWPQPYPARHLHKDYNCFLSLARVRTCEARQLIGRNLDAMASRRSTHYDEIYCRLTDQDVTIARDVVTAYGEGSMPMAVHEGHKRCLNMSAFNCPRNCLFFGGQTDPETGRQV